MMVVTEFSFLIQSSKHYMKQFCLEIELKRLETRIDLETAPKDQSRWSLANLSLTSKRLFFKHV